MVTQRPRDGHLSALGWSLTIQYHLNKDGHPRSQASKILKSDQTKQLQLNKEFDTSAAQLVKTDFDGVKSKGALLNWYNQSSYLASHQLESQKCRG